MKSPFSHLLLTRRDCLWDFTIILLLGGCLCSCVIEWLILVITPILWDLARFRCDEHVTCDMAIQLRTLEFQQFALVQYIPPRKETVLVWSATQNWWIGKPVALGSMNSSAAILESLSVSTYLYTERDQCWNYRDLYRTTEAFWHCSRDWAAWTSPIYSFIYIMSREGKKRDHLWQLPSQQTVSFPLQFSPWTGYWKYFWMGDFLVVFEPDIKTLLLLIFPMMMIYMPTATES